MQCGEQEKHEVEHVKMTYLKKKKKWKILKKRKIDIV